MFCEYLQKDFEIFAKLKKTSYICTAFERKPNKDWAMV